MTFSPAAMARSNGALRGMRGSQKFSVLVGLAMVASLSACGSGATSMMSGGTFRSPDYGTWMMGQPPGYHFRNVSCPVPASLPGSTVRVVLGDMGMMQMMGGVAPLGYRMMLHASPAVVRAGRVSFEVANMGWRTHEMVVLPLSPGNAAGQRTVGPDGRVSEKGSLGEASASCAAGAGEGITSGAAGWVTLTLKPGAYELVCNLPNHYADGMYQALTVTN